MSNHLVSETIDGKELHEHTNRVLGALERVDVEQGRATAQKFAMMNLYANTQFLVNIIGDIAAYGVLKEIRALVKKGIVQQAKLATKH